MILSGKSHARLRWPSRLALGVAALVILPASLHVARGQVAASRPNVETPAAAGGAARQQAAAAIDARLEHLEKMLRSVRDRLEELDEENARLKRGASWRTPQEPAPPSPHADSLNSDGGEARALNAMPPVVIRTIPQAGEVDVDPKLTEIRVTFSKPMHDRSWSWTQRSDVGFPDSAGKIHYEADHRTCVMPVKLEPGKTYWIGLNSERFRNFVDTEGRSSIPYPLTFTTAP